MKRKSFTLQELAGYTETTLIGDPHHCISNVEALEFAGPSDASFLANPQYEKLMHKSNAGVIFVTPALELPKNGNFLVGSSPSLAFQKTAEAIHGSKRELTGFEGIHATAVVHPEAHIGSNVTLGPHVVIDKGASIGDGSVISAACYIGPYTTIGKECLLHPHVTVREECTIGDRVILQPGCVIGACGFGFVTGKDGRHQKLQQLGGVIIGDDVEIGANSTVDRARFKCTEIQRGTKIDNLVQIGHGVAIGQDNLIVAQTGIAGSTKTGRNVVLAGQVAVAGHLKIADFVMVAGRSAISKSIDSPGKYAGHPLQTLNDYQRNSIHLRNIDKYIKRIESIEGRLKDSTEVKR